MNTVLININDNGLPALKKFVRGAKAKMRIIDDEEDIIEKLVEEGLKSETISLEEFKKEISKY